jgi:DNA-binding CsgD family transcriptional regulator
LIIQENDYLAHYGILRKSGRYPWGSGSDPNQHDSDFLGYVAGLRKQGLTEKEVADGLNVSIKDLRDAKTIAKNRKKQADIAMAQRLKEKGYSNVAIGTRMGIRESSVRSLLAPGQQQKADILKTTASFLKDQVDSKKFIDIGTGVEHHLGLSKNKLGTAVALLQEQGYEVHSVKIDQLGTGHQTEFKVLAPPGTTQKQVWENREKIKQATGYSEDGGKTFLGIEPPLNVSSKRIAVRYAHQGGTDADGVIFVRPGVPDLSLGSSRYAQVRIAVDGTHYLKGMAVYNKDLPAGVDLEFNTNKHDTGKKTDAMKKLEDDPENPFGSIVRQIGDPIPGQPGRKKLTSAMNLVNEEGRWDKWSKTLSSQMLSKQPPRVAKEQLDLAYQNKKNNLDEIMALTNPAVRKRLLESEADDLDSAAVHLKAAALPRTKNRVILPVNSLKDNEVYAPDFRDGEPVVLIRHPHGGIFEIPQLIVNNKNPEARRLLGHGADAAKDAIGINSKVAEKLSGADFDGDTVLVIPNPHGKIKTAPSLAGLVNFDPKSAFPPYDGMRTMGGGTWDAKAKKEVYPPGKKPSDRTKGMQMGLASNLITDMTIRGASSEELARAVRHSMVVIDAEKHSLNYRQSAIDNGIMQLMKKYQGKAQGGSSTLISRAKSELRVPDRIPRRAGQGGPVDLATGKKVFTPTGKTFTVNGRVIAKTTKTTKLAEAESAHDLSSGKPIEKVYADHSDSLKSLANQARKAAANTKTTGYSPAAKKTYAAEVASLQNSLRIAQRNAPLERQAQVIANALFAQKKAANPGMDKADIKKLKFLALQEARNRVGAGKERILISDREWAAIQAGAISNHMLNEILGHADLDRVKELATPKARLLMTPLKAQRARSMLADGYSRAEVADHLGVSTSTLNASLSELVR